MNKAPFPNRAQSSAVYDARGYKLQPMWKCEMTPIKHIQQRPNECLLAALCMVHRVDYEVTSAAAQHQGGWLELMDRPALWEFLDRWFPQQPDHLFSIADDDIIPGQSDPPAQEDILLRKTIGVMNIVFRNAEGTRWGHSVAYDHGVIHDPAQPGPESLSAFRARLDSRPDVTWKIDGIYPQ